MHLSAVTPSASHLLLITMPNETGRCTYSRDHSPARAARSLEASKLRVAAYPPPAPSSPEPLPAASPAAAALAEKFEEISIVVSKAAASWCSVPEEWEACAFCACMTCCVLLMLVLFFILFYLGVFAFPRSLELPWPSPPSAPPLPPSPPYPPDRPCCSKGICESLRKCSWSHEW